MHHALLAGRLLPIDDAMGQLRSRRSEAFGKSSSCFASRAGLDKSSITPASYAGAHY